MFRQVMIVVCLASGLAATGCAKKSEQVAASYVSPIQYEDYDCQQVAAEAERISQRVAQLSGVQDSKRTSDVLATTAAVIVFWPAAFMVGGDDAQTAELARLKGQFGALQQASTRKKCGLEFKVQKKQKPPKRQKDDGFQSFQG